MSPKQTAACIERARKEVLSCKLRGHSWVVGYFVVGAIVLLGGTYILIAAVQRARQLPGNLGEELRGATWLWIGTGIIFCSVVLANAVQLVVEGINIIRGGDQRSQVLAECRDVLMNHIREKQDVQGSEKVTATKSKANKQDAHLPPQ
jgi:hypothetical protein